MPDTSPQEPSPAVGEGSTAATKRPVRLGDPLPPEGWPMYLGRYETMTRAVREYAATILDERGWLQFKFSEDDETGPFCAYGALTAARRALGADARAEDLCAEQLVSELRLQVEPGPDGSLRELRLQALAAWNDDADRTVRDVVSALRAEGHRA